MIMNNLFNLFFTNVYAENVAEHFCQDFSGTMKLISIFILLVRIAVPLLIIVIGSLDLYNIVNSGKSDDLNKNIKVLGTRILIGVVVFFIPIFIRIVVNTVDSSQADYKVCIRCIENPSNC